MKILHTADTHFTNKADKLAEVVTTTNFLLEHARREQLDVAIIAGDLVDEHDSPIRVDSAAARAAIRFVKELAKLCPVVIIRGTRSHDRETPYLFDQLKTINPVHVAGKIEMVALLSDNTFDTYSDNSPCSANNIRAVFTLIPSPDKCNIVATNASSLISSHIYAKESLNDMLGYLGEINAQVPDGIPRILVAHGMISGAEFSSGSLATGEDFEYCLSDLASANCDLKAFGHVHKHQSFCGNIFYSGSPGRLNMGETEIKGFLTHTLNERVVEESCFIETPARRFVLYEVPWSDDGIDYIMDRISACEDECAGAEVRFRYSIPEEFRNQIHRDALIARFTSAGALLVKVEPTIIPTVRQRAAGISQMPSMAEKITKYGVATGTEIPARVLQISSQIEGRDIDELIEDVKRLIAGTTSPNPDHPFLLSEL